MKTKTALKAGGNESCGKPKPPSNCGGGIDLSLTVVLAVGIVLGI